MPSRDLTLWVFFAVGALSVLVTVGSLLGALLLAQRRRAATERAHAHRILAAQEDERARVAIELHDDALQRLVVASHKLDAAVQHGSPPLASRINEVIADLAELSTMLRTAAHHLHPSVVEKAGLSNALVALAAEFRRTAGLTVRVVVPPVDLVVPRATGVAAYRIAQEAPRNVVKHAGVTEADLVLVVSDDSLALQIGDAGTGFDTSAGANNAGLGHIGMRQRAEAVGGRVTLVSHPRGGTEVRAVLPMREAP